MDETMSKALKGETSANPCSTYSFYFEIQPQ